MGLVRGEDVVLSVQQYNGTENVYVPFGCARSVTFDISTDFIETSVTESGQFKTFIPSGKQYSGNIEGLVFLDMPAGIETKATKSFNFTQFVDDFPSLSTTAEIQVQLPNSSFINLYNYTGPFLTFNDFIDAINNGINSSGTDFTSDISGNILTITAPSGYGASMNGQNCIFTILTGTPPNIIGVAPFEGGINGYFPSKISLGWLYDKLIYSELIQLKYYEVDDDNHYLQKVCNVYIESINETASFDNMVTFSASFKGNGTPTITYGEI